MTLQLCTFISFPLLSNLPFVHTWWWCWRYTHSWRLSLQIIIWTKHSFIAIVSRLLLLTSHRFFFARKLTFWIAQENQTINKKSQRNANQRTIQLATETQNLFMISRKQFSSTTFHLKLYIFRRVAEKTRKHYWILIIALEAETADIVKTGDTLLPPKKAFLIFFHQLPCGVNESANQNTRKNQSETIKTIFNLQQTMMPGLVNDANYARLNRTRLLPLFGGRLLSLLWCRRDNLFRNWLFRIAG